MLGLLIDLQVCKEQIVKSEETKTGQNGCVRERHKKTFTMHAHILKERESMPWFHKIKNEHERLKKEMAKKNY